MSSPASPLEDRSSADTHGEVPPFVLGDALTEAQRAFLDEHGFLRFRGFLTPDAVRDLLEEIAEIDRRWIGEGRTHVYGVPLEIGRRADGTRYMRRMVFASRFGTRLSALLRDPRLLPLLDAAGGQCRLAEREGEGLVVEHTRAERGDAIPRGGWRTGAVLDALASDAGSRPLRVCLHLDDAPAAKGGLRVLPGTHRQALVQRITRKAWFLDARGDAGEQALEAAAGDLVVHDARLWQREAGTSLVGDASVRRRVLLPLTTGPVRLRDPSSPTPLTHALRRRLR